MKTIDEQLEDALARAQHLEADAQAGSALLTEASKQNDDLRQQLTALAKEKETLALANEEITSQRDQLSRDLATAKQSLQSSTQAVEDLAKAKEQLTGLTAEVKKLKAEAKTAERIAAERYGAASPQPLPVTSRGDSKADELVTRFKAITDPKEQTAFWRSLTPEQRTLVLIFSEITAANYGDPAINPLAPASFDYKKVLAIRESCAEAKMPVSDRALVLDSAYFTNLLGDDIVAKSYMPPIAQPGVVEGVIRRLAGFDIYETVILPENGEKLAGFAAHPSCLCSPILNPPLFPFASSAVAMRYLEPVANYDEAGAVTDPETGLTFGYLRYTECTAHQRVAPSAERSLHGGRSRKSRATASSSPSSVSTGSRSPSPPASSAS